MQLHISQLLAVIALSPLVTAVSLSDFKPQAQNLPSLCDKVYKASIFGCQPSDFTGTSCSSLCIKALQNYASQVQKACYGQQGKNLVTAFLDGSGPSQLCVNAPAPSSSLSSPSSSTANLTSSSAAPTSTSSTPETTTAATTTAAPTDSATSTAQNLPTPTPSGGGSGSPFDTGMTTMSAASAMSFKHELALIGFLGLGLAFV